MPETRSRSNRRKISIQGSLDRLYYRRFILRGNDAVQTSKGKEKEPTRGVASLAIRVRSEWKDDSHADVFVWVDQTLEDLSSKSIWLFSFIQGKNEEYATAAGIDTSDLVTANDRQSTKLPLNAHGSIDLRMFLNEDKHANCPTCGPNKPLRHHPRQPGDQTDLKDILVGQKIPHTAQIWNRFGNALADHFAWQEGWAPERLAMIVSAEEPPAPRVIVRRKRSTKKIEIHLILLDSHRGKLPIPPEDPERWNMWDRADSGKIQTLWPTRKRALHIRWIRMRDDHLENFIHDFTRAIGRKSAMSLKGEKIWGFLWLPVDEREVGVPKKGDKGWYCVWPLSWLVTDNITGLKPVQSVSTPNHLDQLQRIVPFGSEDGMGDTLALLDRLRKGDAKTDETQPYQNEEARMCSDYLPELKDQSGLPSLSEMQSWLTFDSAMDDLAETPADPTPPFRSDNDHLAPVNHDSVDAISSKILSPTANPTPVGQREWEMPGLPIYDHQDDGDGDMVTDNDFDFFDAPHAHTGIFDGFSYEKPEEVPLVVANYKEREENTPGVSSDHGYGGGIKEDWKPIQAEYDPAPPYIEQASVQTEEEQEHLNIVSPMQQQQPDSDEFDDLFGDHDETDRESVADIAEAHNDDVRFMEVDEDSASMNLPESPTPEQEKTPLLIKSSLPRSIPVLPKWIPLEYAIASPFLPRDTIDLVSTDMLPLIFKSSQESTSLKRSRSTDLADLYGDGLVKNRKLYRTDLQSQTNQRKVSLRRGYHESDQDDRSHSDSEEDPLSDFEDFSDMEDSSKKRPISNSRPSGLAGKSDSFDLGSFPWVSLEAVLDLVGSATPLGLQLTATEIDLVQLEEAYEHLEPATPLNSSMKIVDSAVKPSSPASMGFQNWLLSAMLEDPDLRAAITQEGLPALTSGTNVFRPASRIRMRYQGRPVELSATAFKLWKELGLTPSSGPKESSLFAIYDDKHLHPSAAERWYETLSAAYKGSGYGSLVQPGELFESTSLVTADLPRIDNALRVIQRHRLKHKPNIILILLPPNTKDPSTTLLSLMEKCHEQFNTAYPAYPHTNTVLQFSFLDSLHDSDCIDRLASTIYHRLPSHMPPGLSTTVSNTSIASANMPSFTLSPSGLNPASLLSLRWPAPSLSPLDTGRILHVAYGVGRQGQLFVTCLDELGEIWNVQTWQSSSTPNSPTTRIGTVWTFINNVIRCTNIEWRIVVTRIGSCSNQELSAWQTVMQKACLLGPSTLHFELLQCDLGNPYQLQYDGGQCVTESKAEVTVDPVLIVKGTYAIGRKESIRYQVDHLFSASSQNGTICQTDTELMRSIRASFNGLQVLGHLRWGFPVDNPLPPHLQLIQMYQNVVVAA